MREIKSLPIIAFGNSYLFRVFALCIMLFFGYRLYANVETMYATEKQQPIVLVGKVINHDDAAIEGVLVMYNDTKNSAITDHEGKFRLTLNEPSFVSFAKEGYQTLDYKLSETDSSLVVMLSPESNEFIAHGFNSMENIRSKSKLIINVSVQLNLIRLKHYAIRSIL